MKAQHFLWFYSQIYKEKYNISFTKKMFINSKSELEIINSYNREDEKSIRFLNMLKKNYADG